MKVSVIIPTYKDWSRLMMCLDALEKQTYSRQQYEVIVVNNNENGEVPDDINLPNSVKLVHEPEPGSYAARNRGADLAVGDLLAFTDSDCIPDKSWLANAAKNFNRLSCDLIGGKVEIFQPENGNVYAYLYDRFTAFQQHKNVPDGKGVTANLIVKKSVYDKMGGFDTDMKSGGDWHFTLRCTEKGYRMLYCEDVLVLHPARNLLTIFKKQYRLTCGGALSVRKKYGYSHLRILGSHLIHGLNLKHDHLPGELSRSERVIIFAIDTLKYFYRIIIHWALLLRLIDPNKVRE